MAIPTLLINELEQAAPGRWVLVPGRRHVRLLIDGRQVTVFHRGAHAGYAHQRSLFNQRAAIRRHLARQQQSLAAAIPAD